MFSIKIRRTLKFLIVTLLILYYLYNSIFLILTSKDAKKYVGGDGAVFYAAGKMFLKNIPLYNQNSSVYIRQIKEVPKDFPTGSRFLYSPTFAMFFSPLTIFSIKTATIILFILNQAAILLALYILFKIFKQKKLALNDFIFAFIILDFYFPIYKIFKLGQIDILVFLFIVLALFYIVKNKLYKSGFFILLSSFIKPFFLIFPFFLLLKKRYKPFLFLSIFVLISSILIFTFSGISRNIDYYKNVLPKLASKGVTLEYEKLENSTINGFMFRNFYQNKDNFLAVHFDNKTLDYIFLSIRGLIIFLVVLLILYKNNNSKEIILLDFSLLVVVFFLAQTYIHVMYLIFLLIPFTYLFYDKLWQKSKILIILTTISFLLVGYNELIMTDFLKNHSLPLPFQDLRIYGQFLLLGLLVYVLYLRKFTLVRSNIKSSL